MSDFLTVIGRFWIVHRSTSLLICISASVGFMHLLTGEISGSQHDVWTSNPGNTTTLVICVEMRFHSLNDYRQFSAVVWLWNLLDLANLFWLKIFIVANRCVEFGLASWYLSPLWGIWNFIQLCKWGFTFETLPFVMVFLLCFALPKWLLG